MNALFGFLIIINSGIGIVQELRAKRTLDNLAVVGEAQPVVAPGRGATPRSPRDEVVLDDLIEIGPGDQIVVDGDRRRGVLPRGGRVAADRRVGPAGQGTRRAR